MNAYDIMHEWDGATGVAPRTDEELDRAIPPLLAGADYEQWKTALEARDIKSIRLGMTIWGLPMEPLKPFEIDEAIETHERPYSPAE